MKRLQNMLWTNIIVVSLLFINTTYSFYVSRNHTDSIIPSSSSEDGQHSRRAPVTYEFWNYMDFHQFENAPKVPGQDSESLYKQMVLRTLITIVDMLEKAQVMINEQKQKPDIDNPSLLRYGPTNVNRANYDWLDVMWQMFNRWLLVLGSPTSVVGCRPPLPKLQFYYSDPPADIWAPQGNARLCRTDPGFIAYFFDADDPDKLDGIAFCPAFFHSVYRDFYQLDKRQFGPYYEVGTPSNYYEPTYFSARTVFHELLHYSVYYRDIFPLPFSNTNGAIPDISLSSPSDLGPHPAYGAYWSQQLKNPQWQWSAPAYQIVLAPSIHETLYNVDNWVYPVLENYVKVMFQLPNEWQDSPKPQPIP